MHSLLVLTLEPVRNLYIRIAAILPNLLAMTVILAAGLVIAAVVRAIAHVLLAATGFDAWSERTGVASLLKKADIWARPSQAAALFLYWLVILASLLASLTALNAAFIDGVIAGFLSYLPKLLSAVFILVAGSVVAGLIARTLLVSLVNSGFGSARHYARAVRVLLFIILVAMALEQLGIAPGVVVAAFSIIFGGVVLALAIACGIAGVDVIKKLARQESADQEIH